MYLDVVAGIHPLVQADSYSRLQNAAAASDSREVGQEYREVC